ncbi:hypothetical protein DB346_18985 [Verrucomicrobia bacterium LW23]|nr:hypothetical protein DB346_18985 [Verrucomicrobia bacterium LW23]
MTGCDLPVLILGCGYVGRTLARQLQERGIPVLGWVRSADSVAELEAEKIPAIHGNIAEPAAWEKLADQQFRAMVHCASSERGGPEGYRLVYYWGLYQAIVHGRGAPLVFVSSTSVYAQTSGEWVDETSRAEPTVETGRILRKAEAMALGAGGSVLRLAGIYGPGRSALAQKYLNGEAVLEGDGRRVINQIHRDDAASAIRRLLEIECPCGIFNGVDDEPVDAITFYTWCARFFNRPLPPYGPVRTDRKRGLTNKCVSNRALRATGWAPRYPTFREGLPNAFELSPMGDPTPVPAQLAPLEAEPPAVEEPGASGSSARLRTRRRFPPRLGCIGTGLAMLAQFVASASPLAAQTAAPLPGMTTAASAPRPGGDAMDTATLAAARVEGVSESPDKQWVIQRRELGKDAGGIMRHRVEIVSRRTSRIGLMWNGRWRALAVLWSPSGKVAAINDFSTTQGDCVYAVSFVPVATLFPQETEKPGAKGSAKAKAAAAAKAKAKGKGQEEEAPPAPVLPTEVPAYLHKPDHLALSRAMHTRLRRLGKIERITVAADSWKDDRTLQVRVFGKASVGPFEEMWLWHLQPDGTLRENTPPPAPSATPAPP